MLILTNDINEINIRHPKNSVFNFTRGLNKNNKISLLDVLIETNINNNCFPISIYKKKQQQKTKKKQNKTNQPTKNKQTKNNKKTTLITTPVPSTLKVNAPSDIKRQLLIT